MAPPKRPKVHVEVDNQSAAIFWDKSSAEQSIDPITGQKDFEGYRIYRSNTAADFLSPEDFLLNLSLVGEFDRSDDNVGYNTGFSRILMESPKTFPGDTTKYWYRFPPDVLDAVARRVPQPVTAYSVGPVWDDKQPYYAIYLEEPDAAAEPRLKRFLTEFDTQLGVENVEYAAKREGARLGALRAAVIPAGRWAEWDRERLARTGGSPEQYKHPCLINAIDFRETLAREGRLD